jgi:hypothetical protein
MPTTDCHNVQHAIARDTDLQVDHNERLALGLLNKFSNNGLQLTINEKDAQYKKTSRMKEVLSEQKNIIVEK